MAIPFLNNINLSDNELQNAKLHVTSTAPTAAAGQIYFNSTDNVARYHNGTAWVDIPRQISVSGTSLADSQAIDLVAGANVGIAESSGTITISSSDEFQGTVTSVDASTAGDALDVVVTNPTTEPDLAFTWAGDASQYIDGAGNLTTFPTIPTVPSNIVETIITTNGAFIDLTPTTATDGDVTITADLSAGGTPSATTYLRGDNSWEPISAIPGTYSFVISDNAPAPGGPITGIVAEDDTVQIAANADLTSNLTGESSTSKVLTVGLKVDGGVGVSDNYIVNQATAVVKSVDSIPFNDYTENVNPALETDIVKKTTFGTIPVAALTLVKQYIDDSVAGGLIYQGGYNADTNTPDLDGPPSPNNIKKGWTYTVTDDGLFFTEQVRVGDVLIAEVDTPINLDDWTTVQNNVDLASLTQVGIGNVNASTDQDKVGLYVNYSNGTANIGVDIDSLTQGLPTGDNTDSFLLYYDDDATRNKKITFAELSAEINTETSFSGEIGDGSATSIRLENSGAVAPNINHGLGTDSSSFMIQLVDVSSGETVYADVTRGAGGQVTIDFASAPAVVGIRVLIQKIG